MLLWRLRYDHDSVVYRRGVPEKALQSACALARQYIGEGNWEDAKRNLAMAVAIDRQNAEVHEAFALVYQSTGEYELAEENFKKAIKLDKNFSRARNNYAAFLFSQERYKEAEAELNYVVKDTLYPGRPQAFVNLGLCRFSCLIAGCGRGFCKGSGYGPAQPDRPAGTGPVRLDARNMHRRNSTMRVIAQ